MLWRLCCGAAAKKPCKINSVAVLRLRPGEKQSTKEWRSVVERTPGPANVCPASLRLCFANFDCAPRRDHPRRELASHSSGIPALRRPTFNVFSRSAQY